MLIFRIFLRKWQLYGKLYNATSNTEWGKEGGGGKVIDIALKIQGLMAKYASALPEDTLLFSPSHPNDTSTPLHDQKHFLTGHASVPSTVMSC